MENLEQKVLEKIIPFQKKLEQLENSLSEKNNELSILSYVYEYLSQEVEKLSLSERIPIPPEIKLQRIFKKENQFNNEFLEKIKTDAFFSCFDFFSLIQMRLVCKKWDFLISDFMLRAFQSIPCGNDKELREKILEDLGKFTLLFRNEITKIVQNEMNFLKSLKIAPVIINEAFIFFYMSLGHNITKEQKESANFCLIKVRDYNRFINEALDGLISKHLTKQKLLELKKFLEEHPNLTSENCLKANINLEIIFNLGVLKIKYEEMLDENFGEMKFLTLPKYKNIFDRFKANRKLLKKE